LRVFRAGYPAVDSAGGNNGELTQVSAAIGARCWRAAAAGPLIAMLASLGA
jgi:hypothetical protein